MMSKLKYLFFDSIYRLINVLSSVDKFDDRNAYYNYQEEYYHCGCGEYLQYKHESEHNKICEG